MRNKQVLVRVVAAEVPLGLVRRVVRALALALALVRAPLGRLVPPQVLA